MAGIEDIPERRENWAEAEFKCGAKSVVTLRSGHVLVADEPPGFAGGTGGENTGPTPTGFLVAAFAADIPAMLNRIARELGIEIVALRARRYECRDSNGRVLPALLWAALIPGRLPIYGPGCRIWSLLGADGCLTGFFLQQLQRVTGGPAMA